MNNQNNYLSLLSFLLVIIATTGCSSGNNEITDAGSVSEDAGEINPGMYGSLFFQRETGKTSASRMDLRTGQMEVLPNTNWTDFIGIPESFGPSFYPSPAAYERSNIVVIVIRCDYQTPTCLLITDSTGRTLTTIRLPFETPTAGDYAILSRDKQYVALYIEDINKVDWLQIYDMQGVLISESRMTTRKIEWLPDNRLMFAVERKFQITAPLGTEPLNEFTLPENGAGNIRSWTVNREGDKIAYVVANTPPNGQEGLATELKILETESLRIKKVANTGGYESVLRLWSPIWAYDSKWILVFQGGGSGVSPFLMAVPTDRAETLVVDAYSTTQNSNAVLKLNNTINTDGTYSVDKWTDYGFHWQP